MFKITTYHFEEESNDRSNGSKNNFSFKQENNGDEIDATTIKK